MARVIRPLGLGVQCAVYLSVPQLLGAMEDMVLFAVDPDPRLLYIAAMSQATDKPKGELNLGGVEQRVDQLIQAYDRLKQDNDSLRGRRDALLAERAALIEKTELARNRLEAMVTHLKLMERGQ